MLVSVALPRFIGLRVSTTKSATATESSSRADQFYSTALAVLVLANVLVIAILVREVRRRLIQCDSAYSRVSVAGPGNAL